MRNVLFGILSCAYLVFFFGFSYADGVYFSNTQEHLYEPEQKAAITWDGKTETMILSSAVKSDDIANFAWVVPIVSSIKPNVTAGDASIFKKLVDYFMPSRPELYRDSGLGASMAGKGVEIIETKSIDIFDITILRATSSEELIKWLNENCYKIPSGAKSIFDRYISKESYFVANKINLKNKFAKELEAGSRIFAEIEKNRKKLCEKISQSFQKAGCKPWVETDINLDYYVARCIEEAFQTQGIQSHFSIDLGEGLTCEAQCHGYVDCHLDYDGKPYLSNLSYKRNWSVTFLKKGQKIKPSYITYFDRNNGKFSLYEGGFDYSGYDSRDCAVIAKFAQATGDAYQQFKNEVEKREIIARNCIVSLSKACSVSIPDLNKLYEYGLAYRGHSGYGRLSDKYSVLIENTKLILGLMNVPCGRLLTLKKSKQERLAWNYLQPWVFESKRDNFKDLRETLLNLERGMATPLKFEFKPQRPWYPLLISSLNKGSTQIEVYVFGKDPVSDSNSMLKVDAVKTIDSSLQSELKKYFNLDGFKYATRLVFKGECSGLTKDAVFAPDNLE